MITFPAKDIYVTAACHLARGGSLQVIGRNLKEWKESAMFRAIAEEKLIRGMVIYIDHYGNVLTNIDQNMFRKVNKYRSFSIQLRRAEYEISAISKAYSDVPPGEKLALFNTLGLMEISINQGNASKLLGIKQSDTIRIEFYDR
jgi:S-adenosylmethionine hydrolase